VRSQPLPQKDAALVVVERCGDMLCRHSADLFADLYFGQPESVGHASQEHWMNMSRLLIAAGLVMVCCDVVLAKAPLVADLEPLRKFQVEPALTDDDEEVARDISGMACMPPAGATRSCVVVNDQDRSAQFVTIEGHRMIGGHKLQLIGRQPSDAIIGPEPREVECSDGKAKFKDLDGEGVAFAESHFYISGSHGCSRNSNKFRLSSFILARFRVDAQGRVVDRDGTPVETSRSVDQHVETTYRLAEVLRTAPQVGPFFGKVLTENDGLNVEGIAVAEGRLFAALRAPVLKRKAFLVSVSVSDLFSRDPSPPRPKVRVIPLQLGKKTGIRDLASLGDGRFLVLTGPAQEQKKVPYGLFIVDIASPDSPKFLATLGSVEEDGTRGKAEGIVVLHAAADELRVIVLFDSPLPRHIPRAGLR